MWDYLIARQGKCYKPAQVGEGLEAVSPLVPPPDSYKWSTGKAVGAVAHPRGCHLCSPEGKALPRRRHLRWECRRAAGLFGWSSATLPITPREGLMLSAHSPARASSAPLPYGCIQSAGKWCPEVCTVLDAPGETWPSRAWDCFRKHPRGAHRSHPISAEKGIIQLNVRASKMLNKFRTLLE